MTATARWQQLKVLFARSLEQPEQQREAWLALHVGDDADMHAQLRHLLAQQREPAGILGADAHALLEKIAPGGSDVDARLGSTIGAYRLTRELGAGGMGRVYLAERVDGQFAQQVALKLIRTEFASAELRQRFLRERDTLARLAHPNIAQLHDGGVAADGTPYFTLEYIDGMPITRWCDAHASDLRARLRLMLKVCDAVQHAHRNLIVHRDLKPSNILVTGDGEPKLLDFGIAKPLAKGAAESTLTSTDAQPMTREYAAPEQVLGEPVTTATDIYSLGVLLYLLLSGRMPYARAELGQTSWIKAIIEDAPEALHEAIERRPWMPDGSTAASFDDARAIAAARATTPHALQSALRGDLDRIVQRALAKSPVARYPAASALADDLQAYLDGRALSGGTRTYRLRKFVRRYWLPLAAGAFVFGVSLAAAIGLAWEAAQVERQARTAGAVKDFVLDIFKKANPNVARGKLITLRDAVDEGAKRADQIPDEQAALKAEILNTLGTVYFQLGVIKPARMLHERAFELVRERPDDAELAAAAERYAAVEAATQGDVNAAQRMADDALERLHRTRASHVTRARALETAGWIAAKREDKQRLAQTATEALALAQLVPTDDEVAYLALELKGTLERKQHNYVQSIEDLKRALELSARVEGAGDQLAITYRYQIGSAYALLGRYAEGNRYLQEAFDLAQHAFGANSARALRVGEVLGVDEAEAGDVSSAEQHFARLITTALTHDPPDEALLSELRLNHAEALIGLGRYAAAEPLLLAARDFLAAHEGSDPAEYSETLSALGELYRLTGRLEQAEHEQRTALAIIAAAKMDASAPENTRLSRVELDRGQIDAALAAAQEAVQNALKSYGERTHEAAEARYAYGLALAAAGRRADAEQAFRDALHSYALLLPPDGLHLYSADARLALADVLSQQRKERDEAARMVEQALALRRAAFGADDARTHEAATHGRAGAD